MKQFLFLSLFISFGATAATDWKVIAETTNCNEKIQILGKDGEKFVKAKIGDREHKLVAKDGSTFQENSPKTTEFMAKVDDQTFRFIQPSMVEANPPKIDVASNGVAKRCRMK